MRPYVRSKILFLNRKRRRFFTCQKARLHYPRHTIISGEMEIDIYSGGLADTNAYIVESRTGVLLIDAPEGTLGYLKNKKISPTCMVLTHGHWDHIWDAADIADKFKCPVYYHKDDEILCTRPEIMMMFGLPERLKPVKASKFLKEGDLFEHGEWKFKILHIPGHCPGSICLYEESAKICFGGDVLFAGGVGRWDLPGGSQQVLLSGIEKKLMTLPDDVEVFPGHGPSTTIGDEKKSNPYL